MANLLTIETKKELYSACSNFINESISVIKKALDDAQEGANSDSKGSAGDKHETGRAMMHLEKEKNAKQLAERSNLLKVLALIKPGAKHNKAQLGSLIKTNGGNYYLSIAMGKFELNNELFYIVSPVSPIGQLLVNTEEGSKFMFNGKEVLVEGVI